MVGFKFKIEIFTVLHISVTFVCLSVCLSTGLCLHLCVGELTFVREIVYDCSKVAGKLDV